MKLPQLLLSAFSFFSRDAPEIKLCVVLSARSARGISLPAYVLETLAYAITLAYAFRKSFPFSTYGENLFLTMQNALIILCIIFYEPDRLTKSQKPRRLAVASLTMLVTAFFLYLVPSSMLSLLQMSTLPLSLFSKLPQIRQNARSRSTGQLSAIAVISQIAGCLARLFTTATELGDLLVSAGFALALLLNIVMGVQLWMYWGKDDYNDEVYELGLGENNYSRVIDKGKQRAQPPPDFAPPPWQYQEPLHRAATPPRTWARKAD